MCGIAGILRSASDPIPGSWLDRLDNHIAHRGPDGGGRFVDRVVVGNETIGHVALVHRRLSIIDHDGGGQPMVSQCGRDDREGLVALVTNGCIYNHRVLRNELEAAGHRFVSNHSDTEVLIHGHREWGAGLPDRLEGMYAYAIWDRGAACLTLARDGFGEKPLHVRTDSDDASTGTTTFSFCSSRGALTSLSREAAAAPNELAGWTTRFLQSGYGWGECADTMQPGTVARVPAGGRVACDGATGAVVVDRPPPRPLVPTDQPQDDLERRLDAAVCGRLDADVPLGCFLSGGVDSSLVALFAQRARGDLRTFSVRMPDPRFDESRHAEEVAALLGTTHATLDVDPSPADDLTRLVHQLGQPFADSSILPTHWVSRAAREHVAVALSGDGGDELFLGYERYLAVAALARHWRLLRHLPRRLRHRAHPRSLRNKAGRLGGMAAEYPTLGVLATESIFTIDEIASLLGSAFDPRYLMTIRPGDQDARAALRDADLAWYLPEDLLTKVDTASMSVALEVRCPFLDRELAAAALSLTPDQLLPGGQRKGLLRAIARRYLPPRVVDRRKMGFAIPIGEWLRTDAGLRSLVDGHLRASEPFGPLPIDGRGALLLLDEHDRGIRDHGHKLFALLTLSMWARS